jgi:hypothetical protein
MSPKLLGMRKWILRAAVVLGIVVAALFVAGWILARRFEPFVREQAVRYLEERFGTGVEMASLRVSVSLVSLSKIRTAVLRVRGERLALPYRDRPGLPPLIRVAKFELESEVDALWNSPRRIREIRLERLEVNIPPREKSAGQPAHPAVMPVLVDTIYADATDLRIFPSDAARPPRIFEIHRLTLQGTGPGRPVRYRAILTNPKPPGLIEAGGEFGPWQRDDPGLTELSGKYSFTNADLGVFRGIGGTLSSTGHFQGVLRRIEVQGETRTANFRLTGGNPVPLTTRFHSIVDGTSGDTLLQPVRATLGTSLLVARGGIIRREGAKARSVVLDVSMPKGHIEDLLRLAVKSPEPLARGEMDLRTKLEILPREVAVTDKLLLDGTFNLERSHFTAGVVQEKIDLLSRRAQGQPKNEEIADVLSAVRAGFTLRDGEIRFSTLSFHVPGAAIHLKGAYGLYTEQIDLRGIARLQAKVSQTMTGWKRIALKPADPFFSKRGAGTLLPIKITGTRQKPEFGLDRGSKQKAGFADRLAR